ncbi:MAG: ATP-binding protein [Bacillota bacterium]|nr:ATP-binding protein [Bacillota bacterium]
MKEKILIPYAPILVESTRSIGYSFEAALADIIDNSIGKNAKEINVRFRSASHPYVAVIDDAQGMDEEELETAMRYGSKSSLDERDERDLGRFGLGLKMASMSQCRKLTVISKKEGKIHAAQWDLDHIVKKGDWSLLRFNNQEIKNLLLVDELKKQASGTIVI